MIHVVAALLILAAWAVLLLNTVTFGDIAIALLLTCIAVFLAGLYEQAVKANRISAMRIHKDLQ